MAGNINEAVVSRDSGTKVAVKINDGPLKPLGFAQDTTISSASSLPSIPIGATSALINITGTNARWRDDGTSPTASIGIQLEVGDIFLYTGDLAAFEIIEEAASAVLNVSYYI